jgi:hypothetical protein
MELKLARSESVQSYVNCHDTPPILPASCNMKGLTFLYKEGRWRGGWGRHQVYEGINKGPSGQGLHS